MAGGRWYIAFPSGPFRFSTRIACNRYFRRLRVCVRVCNYEFPIRGRIRCTRMDTRDLYIFILVSVRMCVMCEFQVSVADMFLRRSRSRGNYFWSMARHARSIISPARFRCRNFILLQDVRDRDSFREKMRLINSKDLLCYDIKYYVSHLFTILLRIEFFKIIKLNILLVNI